MTARVEKQVYRPQSKARMRHTAILVPQGAPVLKILRDEEQFAGRNWGHSDSGLSTVFFLS